MTPMQIAVGNLLYRKGIAPEVIEGRESKRACRVRTKICKRCGDEKDRDEFRYYQRDQIFSTTCKKCESEDKKLRNLRMKMKMKADATAKYGLNYCTSCYAPNPEFGLRRDGTKSRQCVKCLDRKRKLWREAKKR